MKTVGAFEAKTHLNQLLNEVSAGKQIRITRRGLPIATLVPASQADGRELKQVIREIREIRKGATLGKLKLRELINEGRRY